MGKKLYVGNLPFSTTDQDLNSAFAQAGQVASARVIMDRVSGRSKGFGFVEMGTDEEAQVAISQLNGAQLNGRALTVNEARPPAQGEGGFRRTPDRTFDRGDRGDRGPAEGRNNRSQMRPGGRSERHSRW